MNRKTTPIPFVLLLLVGCEGLEPAPPSSETAGGGEELTRPIETQHADCWSALTPDQQGSHRAALAHAETFFVGTEPLAITETLVLQTRGYYHFSREGEERAIAVERGENGWDVREVGLEAEEEHFLEAFPTARAWLAEEFTVVGAELFRSTEDRVVVSLKFTETNRPWHTFQTLLDLQQEDGRWVVGESNDRHPEDSFQELRAMAAAMETEGLSFHGFGSGGDWGGTSFGDREFSVVHAVDCQGNSVERIVTKAADGRFALLPVSAAGFRAAVRDARSTATNHFIRERSAQSVFRTQTAGTMHLYSRGTDGLLVAGTVRIGRAAGTNPTYAEDWDVELVPIVGRELALARALDQLVLTEGSALETFNGEERSEALWVDPMQNGQVLRTRARYRVDGRLQCRGVDARLQEGAASELAASWSLSFTSESHCQALLYEQR